MKPKKEIEWLKAMSRKENENTGGGPPEVEEKTPAEETKEEKPVEKKKGGFQDVAGFDELKEKINDEFIQVIRNPERAKIFGVRASNMLFFGPPGTGKTYFAEKMAEELGMSSMKVSPDELGSIYMHGSQQKIRACFDEAISKAPTLLIFDEIDALVPKRKQDSSSHQNAETNEFLVMLNNIVEKHVYVVGMTNNMRNIDKAILRTGRFDQLVYFPMPDERVRENLLKYYLGKRPISQEIDYAKLAEMTEGYNCSDIEYMTVKASMLAFNESIKTGNDDVVITQSLMENIIKGQRFSVTPAEVEWYDKMGQEYGFRQLQTKEIGKVGFVI